MFGHRERSAHHADVSPRDEVYRHVGSREYIKARAVSSIISDLQRLNPHPAGEAVVASTISDHLASTVVAAEAIVEPTDILLDSAA